MSVAEKLTAIADKIRRYTAGGEPLTLDDMVSEIDTVYDNGQDNGLATGEAQGRRYGIEQGKKDAYDEFWDDFQEKGARSFYIACFGTGWTSETFKPKYPIKPAYANYMCFNNRGLNMKIGDFVEFADNLAREQGKTPQTHPEMFDKRGHYKLLDFSECSQAIYGLPSIGARHLGTLDFSKCTDLTGLFYAHAGLQSYCVQTIDEFISSEITDFKGSPFQNAIYLTAITMSGVVAKSINFGACPLNEASVRSVVSVLSPTATGQTVTFKGSSKALFSDADWAELITPISNQYDGNWTVAITA